MENLHDILLEQLLLNHLLFALHVLNVLFSHNLQLCPVLRFNIVFLFFRRFHLKRHDYRLDPRLFALELSDHCVFETSHRAGK